MMVLCLFDKDVFDPFDKRMITTRDAKMIHVDWLGHYEVTEGFRKAIERDRLTHWRSRNYIHPVNARLIGYIPEPPKRKPRYDA